MKDKIKKSANEIIPGDIFHPGEHIKDELEARELNQQYLVEKMGLSKSEISLLIHGHRNITPEIAVLLEKALGIDAELWMNLQVKYDLDRVRKRAQQSIKRSNLSPAKKSKLREHIAAA
jgi:HTH-type transcriptional regulator/antitoxin HigA